MTFACICWGEGLPEHGLEVLLLTRVLEKTQEYAVACLQRILEVLPGCPTRDVLEWWSDTGSHFRGYRTFSTIAKIFVEETGCDQYINYGMEEHFKNPADRLFAWQRFAISEASKVRELKEVEDVVQIIKDHYEECKQIDPAPRPALHVEEFWPRHKDDVKKDIFELQAASLSCKIGGSYAW